MPDGKKQMTCAKPSVYTTFGLYVIALAIVVSTNTLYSINGYTSHFLAAVIIVASAALTALYWPGQKLRMGQIRIGKIHISQFKALLGWLLLVYLSNFLRFAATGDRGTFHYLAFVLFLGYAPLFITALKEKGLLETLLLAFVNVVAVLALISLVLWVAGPLLGLISPNCSIANGWTGVNKLTVESPGYFYLLFSVQDLNVLGVRVVRNTSVFVEAPMYALVLCVALVFECLLLKKRRPLVVALMTVSVFTTIAVTGTAVVMGLGLAGLLHLLAKKQLGCKHFLYPFMAAVAVCGACVAVWLLRGKVGSASWLTRIDDFVAGYKTWIENVWFGCGMRNQEALVAHMSDFRLGSNIGFSNSLMGCLARGGLVFSAPLFVGWLSYFLSGNRRYIFAGLLFFFLWAVTNILFLPLTAFLLGLGVSVAVAKAGVEEEQPLAPSGH